MLKKLTPRQKEVLQLTANGLCNKEIARELRIEYGTVRTHIDKISLILQTSSVAQSVSVAIRNGLI